jgi:hypothetical protein
MRFITTLSSAKFAINCVEGDAAALARLFPGMTDLVAHEVLRQHRFGCLVIGGDAVEIADRLCGPPDNAKRPAENDTCQECAMGAPIYIPCGRPAEFMIENRSEVLPMCAACADHNVRNRDAFYQVEKVEKL